jgi:putative transposase
MSRNRNYLLEPELVLHAYNWAIDGRTLFHCNGHFEEFLELLLRAQKAFPVSVVVYVLLPDRFDLVLLQHRPFAVARFMKMVCHDYAWSLNRRLNRRGLLFDGRYRGDPVLDPEGLLLLSYSLHRSPLTAGATNNLEQWQYSSYDAYTNQFSESLVDPSLILDLVGGSDRYRQFLKNFNACNPNSVREFFAPDYISIWGVRRDKKRQREGF